MTDTPAAPSPRAPQAVRAQELPFDVDLRRLNLGVGYVALGLPLALPLVFLLTGSCFHSSISHYYFTRIGGDILVGALSFIGLLLMFFYGFQAPTREGCLGWHRIDVIVLKLAGLAAVIVAFVPTTGSGCRFEGADIARVYLTDALGSEGFHPPGGTVTGAPSLDFWASFPSFAGDVPIALKLLHFGAAGVMFLILGYFSFYVFTRINSTAALARGNRKDRRNGWYRALGRVIFAVVGVLAIKAAALELILPAPLAETIEALWDQLHLTFLCEAAGLIAFGLSWMIKGRFLAAFEDAAAIPQARAA